MSKLEKTISQYWNKIQCSLFSFAEEGLDYLIKKQQELIAIIGGLIVGFTLAGWFGLILGALIGYIIEELFIRAMIKKSSVNN